MNLQRFLALTADVPELCLRVAMVKAMAVDRPGRSYPVFYRRVIDELRAIGCAERPAA